MGDYCIIARRLSDHRVQYGCGGCDGRYMTVGFLLQQDYDSPDMVEYLFSLGQLNHLGFANNKGGRWYPTEVSKHPHWVGDSERLIFSRMAFPSCGFLYDADNVWYHVTSGPFRIKTPLALIEANVDEHFEEFSFLEQLEFQILDEIFSGRYAAQMKQSEKSQEELQQIHAELKGKGDVLYRLWEDYRYIFNCFDDWVLIRSDKSGRKVGGIVLQPREERHMETIFW